MILREPIVCRIGVHFIPESSIGIMTRERIELCWDKPPSRDPLDFDYYNDATGLIENYERQGDDGSDDMGFKLGSAVSKYH